MDSALSGFLSLSGSGGRSGGIRQTKIGTEPCGAIGSRCVLPMLNLGPHREGEQMYLVTILILAVLGVYLAVGARLGWKTTTDSGDAIIDRLVFAWLIAITWGPIVAWGLNSSRMYRARRRDPSYR